MEQVPVRSGAEGVHRGEHLGEVGDGEGLEAGLSAVEQHPRQRPLGGAAGGLGAESDLGAEVDQFLAGLDQWQAERFGVSPDVQGGQGDEPVPVERHPAGDAEVGEVVAGVVGDRIRQVAPPWVLAQQPSDPVGQGLGVPLGQIRVAGDELASVPQAHVQVPRVPCDRADQLSELIAARMFGLGRDGQDGNLTGHRAPPSWPNALR